MSMFFIVASVILWLMQVTVGAWLYFAFPQVGWKIPVVLAPAALTLAIRFSMEYTRTHWGAWEGWAYYLSYTWGGLVFLAFCICALCALVQWALFFFHVNARAWLGPVSVGLMALVSAMAIYGGASSPRVKRVAVSVPGAPKMKIVLLSDSHLGLGVSLKRFDKAMNTLEAEKPDVLLVLGDVFEYGPHRRAYAERLAQADIPLGVYGVFGNHEYYVGYENSKQFFKDAGITLLENETAELPGGVQVAGVKDVRTARVSKKDVENLLAKTDKSRPLIYLSHTPLYAEEAASGGADLMFSGHTHNGQIFPFNYLVRLQFPRVYGLFDVDGMKFYITSGMFYWGVPLRFLAPAEIPVIEVNE